MGFLLLLFVLALIIQSYILFGIENRRTKKLLSPLIFAVMECFPLTVAVYYAVTKKSDFIFDWTDNIILCLWMAGAILLGYALALLIYALKKTT